MSDKCETFAVNMLMTVSGYVLVRASSVEEAINAVQKDLKDGGYVLEDDLNRIKVEDAPESDAILSGEKFEDCEADYYVDESGSLKRN